MKIAIVAGEESGDQLGAGLISSLRKQLEAEGDELELLGVGGKRMRAEGFNSFAPMELLSVMGIVEPLKRLPALLKLRSDLFKLIKSSNVDVMIGIDSPDFNIGLERKLKREGIPCCHYVCPSVWAWRQNRVHKIRKSVDHVLTLLPFEQAFLARYQIASTFVGHPVADQFKQEELTGSSFVKKDMQSFNGVTTKKGNPLICVMPGSRHSELDRLLDVFTKTVKKCLATNAQMRFVIPAVNESIMRRIDNVLTEQLKDQRKQVELVLDKSHYCINQSDAVLLASGTASLEAGLLAKPMVVAYRLGSMTYQIAKRMVKTEYFSLPNLLLNEKVVPELIQDQASPDNLTAELMSLLNDPNKFENTVRKLETLMPLLAINSNQQAASAVLELVDRK